MSLLTDEIRSVLTSGKLAHLVTVNEDGSPQVSIIWIDVDGDEIVSGHMSGNYLKLRNIRRDPRVVISVETDNEPGTFMAEHIVLRGTARVTEGGAPELLRKLGKTYVAPDFEFPLPEDAPQGYMLRITVDRVGGLGPWVS